MMKIVFFLTITLMAQDRVLDLGTLGIKATQRGPDIEVIDSNNISMDQANRFLIIQFREIERELLKEIDLFKKGQKSETK